MIPIKSYENKVFGLLNRYLKITTSSNTITKSEVYIACYMKSTINSTVNDNNARLVDQNLISKKRKADAAVSLSSEVNQQYQLEIKRKVNSCLEV